MNAAANTIFAILFSALVTFNLIYFIVPRILDKYILGVEEEKKAKKIEKRAREIDKT